MTRHRGTGTLLLAVVASLSALLGTGEAQTATEDALRARIETLATRERECESRAVTIGQQRVNAAAASYPSPEAQRADWDRLDRALAAERQCTARAEDEILQTLTSLEIECQRVDSAAARQCTKRARDERAVRKQLQALRDEQSRCEQNAMKADGAIRRGAAATDVRSLERRRDESVACARSAGAQQENLKRALAARGADEPGSPAQQLAAETRAQQYQRDTQALLELLRQTLQGLEPGNSPRYDAFAQEMDSLQRGLSVYRSRYPGVIASSGATRPRKLLEAADLLVSTTGLWRAELQARREAAGLRNDVDAGSRPDSSVSTRLALPGNRRALESFMATERAAGRERAEAWQRAKILVDEASAAAQ